MSRKDRSGRSSALFQTPARVQASEFSDSQLYVRNERLSNSEPFGNGDLFLASCEGGDDSGVPGVHFVGTRLHSGNHCERGVCTLSFDLNIWAAKQQQFTAVVGVAGAKREERKRGALGVCLNPPVAEASVYVHEHRLERVSDSHTHTAFPGVDLNGTFAVEKPGEVSRELIVRKRGNFHRQILAFYWLGWQSLYTSMAVPVMRWIGERIELVNAL
jgi:hypothetical protein